MSVPQGADEKTQVFEKRVPAFLYTETYSVRNGKRGGKNRLFFSERRKRQKDYCVSFDAKKFRVEITRKMAYNLEMLQTQRKKQEKREKIWNTVLD